MTNITSDFLGSETQWNDVVITLEAAQTLRGGLHLQLRRGQAWVTLTRPGQRPEKYWFLPAIAEIKNIQQLLLVHDFLTLTPAEHPDISDEARPVITVTNAARQSHRVAKGAGVKDDRFDAIYDALMAIAQQIENRKPFIPSESRGWAIAKITGATLLALGVIVGARLGTRFLLHRFPLQTPQMLILPVLTLAGLVFLLLMILFFLEWLATRQKSFFSRSASLLLVFIGLLYVINLTLVFPFLLEAGMSQWGVPTVATIQAKFENLSYDSDTGITHTNYYLRYAYSGPSGKQYMGKMGVKKAYYDTQNQDDQVTIYYLPQWPRWSVLEASQSATSRVPFLLASLLTLIGWLCSIGIISYIFLPLLRVFT